VDLGNPVRLIGDLISRFSLFAFRFPASPPPASRFPLPAFRLPLH
jgi:hypothetical protein